MLYAGQLSQTIAIGTAKISVLLLYRRIFRGDTFNKVTYGLLALVLGWTIAFLFANMLECVPIDQSWVAAPGQGGNPHCIHAIAMYFSQVYSDVILDISILIVPIPLSMYRTHAITFCATCADCYNHQFGDCTFQLSKDLVSPPSFFWALCKCFQPMLSF